jgi:hypothetical protein
MSTRDRNMNVEETAAPPLLEADNLTAIYEPTV